MTTFLLSPAEVAELTGRQRYRAQARVLRGMGIAYEPRPDGSLAVLRSHAEKVLGGEVGGGGRIGKSEPDWGSFAPSQAQR